jgi:D,D-heptose 1,7-bisphosphate phosphatase
VDDGKPRGTCGAVLASFDKLDERFVVLYGDTLLNVDLRTFLAQHKEAGADATLFLHPNDHPADSDLVEIDADGWIQAFHPYPHNPARYYPNLVNAALYAVEKRALAPWRDFKVPSDFGKDLFPAMLQAGARLKGYKSFEYIKDVGTPARLSKASEQLRKGLVGRASLARKQKAVFLDRDGTMNFHRDFIRSAEAFELMPGVAEAVKRLNEAEYRVVLVTNQPVIARGETSFAEVSNIHAKLESELGQAGAFLDAIYMCPHHPDGGFAGEVAELKIPCDCRKPNTGMIARAVRELNIDLAQSWLIGDTTLDLETARRAEVKSILVRTGMEGKDGKYEAKPDYTADTLGDAADLIISRSEIAS